MHAATMADSVHIHNVTLPYALRQSVLLYAPMPLLHFNASVKYYKLLPLSSLLGDWYLISS